MTRKERGTTLSKNIFISFILLVCILLVFIHLVGEEEYKILVSIVAGILKKKQKRELKMGRLELEWASGYLNIIYPCKYEHNWCYFNTDLVKIDFLTSSWNKKSFE